MGLFENKRFTVVSISILVILNLVLIGLIVGPRFGKKDHNRKGEDRRSEFVARKLGFSDTQKQSYDSLNTHHRKETKMLQQRIDGKRREMFKLTRNKDTSFEMADSLSSVIGILVSDMEFRTYEHISNVRALCTEDQLQRLDSLVQRMIKSHKPDDQDNREPPPPR